MDVESDSAGGFGDESAVLESVVNAFDGVVLHGQQEARRHLRTTSSRVEQRRGSVGEPGGREEEGEGVNY